MNDDARVDEFELDDSSISIDESTELEADMIVLPMPNIACGNGGGGNDMVDCNDGGCDPIADGECGSNNSLVIDDDDGGGGGNGGEKSSSCSCFGATRPDAKQPIPPLPPPVAING